MKSLVQEGGVYVSTDGNTSIDKEGQSISTIVLDSQGEYELFIENQDVKYGKDEMHIHVYICK